MSEWFKETVLKTVDAQASRGSNPRFSEMERCSVLNVPIAQLDRALVCGTKGRRFESSWVQLERCESG